MNRPKAFEIFSDHIRKNFNKHTFYCYDHLTCNEAIERIQKGEKPEDFVYCYGRKIKLK